MTSPGEIARLADAISSIADPRLRAARAAALERMTDRIASRPGVDADRSAQRIAAREPADLRRLADRDAYTL